MAVTIRASLEGLVMQSDPASSDNSRVGWDLDPSAAGRLLTELVAAEFLPTANDRQSSADRDAPVIEGYLIERLIGSGGSGDVYLAYRIGSERPLALKTLRLGVSGSTWQDSRSWREMMLLRELHLPCLPRLIDCGSSGRLLYTATEFIDGLPLDKYADEHALPTRNRVEFMAQVAEAIHSLHEHGVIHRDIKPSNILIDCNGRPIIIDLGIAALLDHQKWTDAGADGATLVEEGRPIGTPAFMSPEQARGERARISTRSDVYGLGATAYVLLTDRPPHDTNATLHEAIRRVAQDDPIDPRVLRPALPKSLSAVLQKAVARSPEHRYPSAAAFAEDLRRWTKGLPVEAQAPNHWQRVTRLMGRHPVISTAVACVLVGAGILVGTRVSVWWWFEEPGSVIILDDGREAQLRTRGGAVLRSWRALGLPDAGPIDLAALRVRPAQLGGGTVVVTMAQNAEERNLSGKLCVWDAHGDFLEPEWTAPSPAAPLVPPRPPQPDDDTYRATHAFLADIFRDRDHPGEEIVVTFTQTGAPAALRVLDLSGQTLFELWHRGTLGVPLWHDNAGLLLLIGLDNRFRAKGEYWEAEGWQVDYPFFTAAVRPVLGARLPIVNKEDLTEPDLEWYRYVTSADGNTQPPVGVKLGMREGPGAISDLFFLGFSLRDGSSTGWTLNAHGEIVSIGAADGFLEVNPSRGAERMNDYQLVDELPEGMYRRVLNDSAHAPGE